MWTSKQVNDVIEQYKAGKPLKVIGRPYGKSHLVIAQLLRRHGVPARVNKTANASRNQTILLRLQAGHKVRTIAQDYGLAYNYTYTIAKRMGWKFNRDQ